MIRGTVTKLVSTFGSQWGRILVDGTTRELFFNTQSLQEPSDFARLQVGQAVEFDAHADQINGEHAENLAIVSDAEPAVAHADPAS
jgi:cold shock CspA family protein